jgi:drug/metabolite transporter (DMT)-like permease
MRDAFRPTNCRTNGIICIVGAALFLTANDSIIKWLSPFYPLHEIVLVRAVVALVLTLLFVQLEGGLHLLRTRRPALHFLRGFLIVIANMAFFLALASMPLAEATALFFVNPLFIMLLSVPILGERVGLRRWLAMLAGLAGVVVMLRPGFGVANWATLLPLVAALAYASMQMLTRRLGVIDKASTLAFYIQLTFVLISAAIGLAVGDGHYDDGQNTTLEFLFRAWTWPTLSDAGLMALCGCLVGAGGYLLSQAYRVSEASVVAPFEYTSLPLALFWGLLIWGDLPDVLAFLGISLIVGSGLFVFYRETLHARRAAGYAPKSSRR